MSVANTANTTHNVGIRRNFATLGDRNFENVDGTAQYACGHELLEFLGTTYHVGDSLPFDVGGVSYPARIMETTRLNLGSSDDRREGFISVDIAPPADVVFDLRQPWTRRWPESSVDEIYAKDVLEHIDNAQWPAQKGIIWCMNNAHKILKPGGKFEIIVPCLPGIAPWVDPTHVSVWTSDLRYYFDQRWDNPRDERGRLGPGMGITALFRTVGGRSGKDWTPIQYAPDAPERRKLFLVLEAVK